jgi:hypothetical protein
MLRPLFVPLAPVRSLVEHSILIAVWHTAHLTTSTTLILAGTTSPDSIPTRDAPHRPPANALGFTIRFDLIQVASSTPLPGLRPEVVASGSFGSPGVRASLRVVCWARWPTSSACGIRIW